jgi:phosphohistidine swiveling domain-containing protein
VVGVGDGATAAWDGREVTVDGTAGVVYAGILPTRVRRVEEVAGLATLVDWARERVAVEVAGDAAQVRDLDAEGFGLDSDRPADPDALLGAMRGAQAISGSVLGSHDGARAALRSGVPVIVCLPGQRPEVLLLRLAQANQGEVP